MTQWLRLWHGTATDPKWRTVARRSGQPIPSVLAVWMMLLENASENATERGRTHDWSNEVVGVAIDIETARVEAIIEAMQGLVLDGDRLTGWEKRQPKREDNSAERAREWRANAAERKRTQRNAPEQIQNREEKKGVDPPLGSPPTVNGHSNGARDGRGTRLAEDWRPDADERAYAAGLGLDPDRIGDCFRDFWLGKPGAGGRKADWPATWRNWCRRAADELAGKSRSGGNGQGTGGLMDATARVLARQMRAAGSG